MKIFGAVALVLLLATALFAGAGVAAENTSITTWDELEQNITAWGTNTEMLTIKLAVPLTNTSGDNHPGIQVRGHVTIMPASSSGEEVVIDARQHGRIFNVVEGGNLTLTGNGSRVLNVTGGYMSVEGACGGGIYVQSGNLTLAKGAIISNCSAMNHNGVSSGGGVYVANGGNFTMYGGNISNCSAYNNGGGVYVCDGNFTMYGGNISGCSADKGCGVYVCDGNFTMYGGAISNCSAPYGGSMGGGVYVYSEESVSNFIMYGGNISGCSAPKGGGVYVYSEESVSNFIMYGGNISGCSAYSNGGGVYVANGGNFTMYGGNISNCSAQYGGGVFVAKDCTFTMYGGAISGCSASASGERAVAYGGGVYVYDGTFTLSGGAITNCSASVSGEHAVASGGGVYICSEESVSNFIMSGGAISNCSASASGGVAVASGGGVFVYDGTFNLSGGTISNCSAGWYGGGVDVNGGTFTMYGGAISNCSARGGIVAYGGGVYVDEDCTFTMYGGNISGCSACYGGGVYLMASKKEMNGGGNFIMSGGNISGCSASSGAAVFNKGTFTVNGTAQVAADNDVALIKISVPRSRESTIYNIIALPSFTGNILNISLLTEEDGNIAHNPGRWMPDPRFGPSVVVQGGAAASGAFALSKLSAYKSFVLEDYIDDLILGDYKPPYVEVSTWAELSRNVSEWTDQKTQRVVVVTDNISREDGDDDNIFVYGNVLVTANYSDVASEVRIDGKGAGRIFEVEEDGGNLTLIGNGSKVLNVTGGDGDTENGGGILVKPNANLTLADGAIISNCSSTGMYGGGGVYVMDRGRFTMLGGSIIGCSATKDGGGVYVDPNGIFTMYGGNISGCNATGVSASGGGVYVNNGNFTMYGGSIIGCSAAVSGGGVYVEDSMFNVEGAAQITGNTAGDKTTANNVYASNVYLSSNNLLQLIGDFTGSIGIVNVSGEAPAADAQFGTATGVYNGAERFFADTDPAMVGSRNESNALVWTKRLDPYVEVSSWDQLSRNVSEWTSAAQRVVVVAGNISRTDAENPDGIAVYGNVLVTTNNSGAGEVRIDGKGAGRIFEVKTGGNLTLIGNGSKVLNVTGGYTSSTGGGISVASGSNLTLAKNAVLSNCSATKNGGGVYVYNGGIFSMSGGTISGSNATQNGGGVYVCNGGIFSMSGGNISGCYATQNGGGVFLMSGAAPANGGIFNMSGGNISGCSATKNGGGVYVSTGGIFSMSGGNISGCHAPFGAAVYNSGAFTVSGSAQVAADNDAALVVEMTIPFPKQSTTTYHNLTAGSSFNGKIQNISLLKKSGSGPTLSHSHNLTAWLNQVVVQNGAAATEAGATFALSTLSNYSGYALVKNGTNLTLGKYLSPYVEVSSWDQLSQRVSEWTSAAQRVVVVTGNITDRGAQDPTGISVRGNVLVTTNNSGAGEVRIDGKGAGRIFNVLGGGNLTLIGNESKVLNVTGGYMGEEGGGIWVESNSNLTLAKNAVISNCSATKGGGVFIAPASELGGAGTFTMSNSSITGCKAGQGGGVFNNYGTFTMSNSSISGCNASGNDGGGVYNDGTFNMSGSSITDCSAADGGGVGINIGGTFIMNSSSISGCSASGTKGGGGVYIDKDGTFIMNSSSITNCSATNGGGGVYISEVDDVGGTFIMTDSNITGCSASGMGGGVYVSFGCTFTMFSGNITGCNASGMMGGGGVCNYGTFTMFSGNISGCSASGMGGGVCNVVGTFNMSGGKITDCRAPFGAGVINAGLLAVNGTAQVAADNDVALVNATGLGLGFCNIVVDPSFRGNVQNISLFNMTSSPSFNPDPAGWLNQTVVQNGAAATAAGATFALSKLPAYSGYALVKNGTNLTLGKYLSPYVEVSSWAELSQRVSEWTSAEQRVVVVTGNITDRDTAEEKYSDGIAVYGNVLVTTNSSGVDEVRIDGKGAGRIFKVETGGNLTLIGNGSKVLNVTGGYVSGIGGNGGGILVDSNATLTLAKNATISNSSADSGGGVSVYRGNFTMSGGNIIGCRATIANYSGGGVYLYDNASFTMSGGTIVGCRADFGGGVVVDTNCNFTMSGGSIVGCNAGRGGGGVYIEDGTFTQSGGSIAGCNATDYGGGVYVFSGNFTMSGGSITGCNATGSGAYGGAVNVANDGNFTMSGGTIRDCRAGLQGGGVDNYGKFTMLGGNISDCFANVYGGGVITSGTFTLSGGNITRCSTSGIGGGVLVSIMLDFTPCDSTFIMNGGNITDCQAAMGAGVGNLMGIFAMSGGNISGCSAPFGGSGVGNAGYFAISGTAQISADNDVAQVWLNLSPMPVDLHCNITVDQSYNGKVQNITLFNLTSITSPIPKEDPAGWLNHTVVQYGAVHKDNFTLAPHLTSAGYYLTPGTGDKANDLVLAKTNVRTVYVNETITTETEDHFQNISGALKATADKDALIILETNVTLQDSLYISPTHNVTIDGQMHHIKQGFTKESLENTQNTIKLSLTHLADSNVVTIKDVVLNFSNNPGDVFIYNNAKSTYPKAHLVNVTIADIYTQELLKMRSALHIDGANVTAENLSFKFTNETTKALEEPDNLLEYLVSTIDLEATSHEYHASNLTIDNLTYGAYGKYADAAKKPVVINSGTATAVEPIDIELLFGRHVAIWPGFAKDRVHEVSSWDDLKTLTTSPGKLQFGDTIRLNSYIVSPGTGENISLPAGILINPVAEGGKHCVINLTATDSIIVNDALGLAGILGYDKAVTYGAGKVVAGESFINPELLKDNLFIPPGTTIQIDESIAEKQNNVTITIPEAQTLVLTVDGNGTVRVKENKNLIVTGKGAVNLSDDPREYDTALIVNGTINLYAPVTKWPKFGVTGNGTINIYTNKSVIPASNGVNISVAAFTLKSDKGQIQNGTTIVNPATELALNGTAWDIYNNATMKVGNVNYTLIPTTPGYSGVWEMDAKSGKVSGVGNLKANFTANVTKVIFHNATGIQENKSYTYKGAVTMPAVPTKQGFTFAGWNVSEGSSWKPFNSSEYNASGIWNYTGAESSLDVYANWTAVAQYNITNNTVNGTVTPSATKAAAGATIHVTAVADSGYHFADWNVTNATAKIDVKDGNFTMPASDVNAGANFTANVTNVIFHNATGVQEQKSYTYLGKVTMPAVPTKQGFTFAGWNVSVDEDGWTPFNSSSYNDNGIWKYTNASGKALHVYANWTAVAQYTITNSTVNGTVTPSATKAAAGATIHVTAKADSGYHFADWNVTNATAKIDVKDGNFTMPASDVNAGANFTANVTNVIFHNATGVQEQKSYTYLGKVTMPAVPTKQGFTFAGWNVSVGTTWASFNSSSYNDNGIWKYTNASGTALHVYANWTAVAQYTITNNTVNGTVTPSATKAAAGATIHVMAKADDGYHFADWNVTNATAKLPVDASGNFTMPASDVNAAANFTANVTNVIFHNATGVQEQKSYTYKGAVTMPAVPTKQGFTFAGWNVSVGKNWENFNSSAYNDNGIWKYTNASGTALNVYANWSAVAQYTITNSTVNGTVTPSATKAAAGATIHVTAVADSGYHFADWNVTNATAKIDVKDGNFTMPASDVNAGANFTANVTKVIFHNATGIQEQKSYTYKGAVTMPAVPTKQGFTFAGWNVSVGQSWENFNSSAYNDNGTWKYTNASGTALHVYANWTAVAQYNITNSTVNGTVTPSATKAAAGATIHVTAVADRGYHFADWNVTNATAKIDVKDGNFTMPASDVNAAANFTANVTNVIFHNATGIQEQKSYTYKGAVTMPAVPSKEGFTFIGWNVSVGQSWENFNSSAYNDNGIWKYTGVNGSTLNVYAAWTPAEILVTTNTISLGTYDINGQNSSALHDGSVNITNNMPESITVINDNPEIFTISPVSSDIPSLSTKQFTVTLNDAAKSRLGDHVANLSIKGEPYVRLTVSVVDTTEHKTNTTVIPGLPEIETEVKEIEGKEVITNITVKEENVKIDTSGDVTNATISNDITSDKVVEIHITDIENISGGAGKEKIILKPNSTVTTTYPVTKADLITRNAVKVEYKANISLYALTSSAPPTLTGDFDEDVSTTVKNTMKTERLNVNVLSMVSSVNKEVDKFNNQIKELTLTFEIPASSVTSKDRLKAYHVKNGKADKLNDNNVTVSDKTWSAGQYVYFVTIKSGYGFSSYVVGEESSQPAPSPTSGGGGGGQSGSSVWITPTPTITPTVTPTATPIVTPTIQPTSTVQKTTTPTANPTKTPASPLMFAGILAGLGAAAAVCLRRR